MPRALFLALCLFALAGCGSGSSPASPESPKPEVTSAEDFKKRIEFIAQNGGMGSAFAGLEDMAKQHKDTSLVADAKQLSNAKTPDQAKAIAKKMLDKLNK